MPIFSMKCIECAAHIHAYFHLFNMVLLIFIHIYICLTHRECSFYVFCTFLSCYLFLFILVYFVHAPLCIKFFLPMCQFFFPHKFLHHAYFSYILYEFVIQFKEKKIASVFWNHFLVHQPIKLLLIFTQVYTSDGAFLLVL